MRICLDARSLCDHKTGLGRYAASLVRHIAHLDQENEYLVIRRPGRPGPIVEQENFSEIYLPWDISSAGNILAGALGINRLRPDVYHALFHFLPVGIQAGRVVITLHDLIWVQHSNLADNRRWRRRLKGTLGGYFIRRALNRADHIVAISESTRQAALAGHGVPADKISVVYHGVDLGFGGSGHGVGPEFSGGQAYDQGRDFIFSLGNALPYKNLTRLLQAYAQITSEYPRLDLLVSGRGEDYPRLIELSGQLAIADRVRFSAQLSDAQVRSCFARAVFFAFPSLVEGFGLPVLEAMASGCPVLTSSTSSLGEIAGADAVTINPTSVDSIVGGMKRLLGDARLRRQLAKRGRRRAAGFTWEDCARQTLEVYRGPRPYSFNRVG